MATATKYNMIPNFRLSICSI